MKRVYKKEEMCIEIIELFCCCAEDLKLYIYKELC